MLFAKFARRHRVFVQWESAIKSYAKGKIHLSRKPDSSGIASFFSKSKENVSSELSTSSSSSSCFSKDQRIDTILLSNDTVRAQIM